MDDVLASPLPIPSHDGWERSTFTALSIPLGLVLWFFFGLTWWLRRAWRDFLNDADWYDRTAVERTIPDEAAIHDEAKP
jgi:hypothetical protein